ncbi:PREDICTED: lysM domain receptor-like kinase 3 [Lupinus angustifolius]|nr:PREDICTED: lysM domain receptor-like kinase 3 [Lupinus angustifolius]
MCKTKMATNASSPTPRTRSQPSTQTKKPSTQPNRLPATEPPTSSSEPSTSYSYNTGSTGYRLTSDTSISSRTSLSSLRHTLPENPHIYDFSEISSATNNFLSKRHSSSSATPSWRCILRGADVIVFQRKFRHKLQTDELRQRLSVICRSHHVSIIKLLGASISGDHIYLVYEFVNGANLADCLRNTKNVHFTVLSTWLSRMQVATDLAHALDYVHNKTGLNINIVHNHIKSSGIIVTEPSFNARVCHFGAAQLCGDIEPENETAARKLEEIVEEKSDSSSPARSKELRRSESRRLQFQGVRGYMSPEFQAAGVATQKSDVYAFGVVLLELLTGEEPLKFRFDKNSGDFVKTSVIDTARYAVDGGGEGSVEGRLRKWVDRRLKDSFPVEVAEKVTRVALDCVHVDPDKRPNMGRVAGKISKLYLESTIWSESIKMPTGISVSLAAR